MNNSLLNKRPAILSQPVNTLLVKEMAESIKSYILEGHEDNLDIAIKLKAINKVIDNVFNDDDVKAAFLKEARKEGKSFVRDNVSFDIRYAGGRNAIDYSACDDPTWNHINAIVEDYSGQQKIRETFLKSIASDFEEITPDGEVITIHPPLRQNKETLVITIK